MKKLLTPITNLDQLDVGMTIFNLTEQRSAGVLAKTGLLIAVWNKSNNCIDWLTLTGLENYQLQVTDEPWKPKEGERYFFPCITAGKPEAIDTCFAALNSSDQARLAAGMCFKTEAETLAAAQKMLDAIKPNQL